MCVLACLFVCLFVTVRESVVVGVAILQDLVYKTVV